MTRRSITASFRSYCWNPDYINNVDVFPSEVRKVTVHNLRLCAPMLLAYSILPQQDCIDNVDIFPSEVRNVTVHNLSVVRTNVIGALRFIFIFFSSPY